MSPTRRRYFVWTAFVFWCAGLTGMGYGSALALPFFFDDFVHVPYVDAYSLAEIWQTAGNLAYYRPLPFTIWKVMHGLAGFHSPAGQHALNLLLHMVNGLMAGWLAGRLWGLDDPADESPTGRWPRSFLVAALFLLFPFSYQAVPWIGSLAHLLVTTMVLFSLVSYWLMKSSGRRNWGILSFLAAAVAPFAHENGSLVGPLLGVTLFLGADGHRDRRRHLRHTLLWSLPALIWLPIWWFAPKAISGSVGVRGVEPALQNSAYFLQGIFYPLSSFGGRLLGWGINDILASLALSVAAILVIVAVHFLAGSRRRSLISWLWCAISSLPAILFLSFDYVINGPRLLMLTSVGISWLWADAILAAGSWLGRNRRALGRSYWLRTAVLSTVCAAILLRNYSFIRERMRLHEILGKAHRQATALVEQANRQGRTAVFLNFPTWLAPPSTAFALGHEGVEFLPQYVPHQNLITVNTGRPGALRLVRVEALRPSMPYHYDVSGSPPNWSQLTAERARVFLADYSADNIISRPVGAIEQAGPAASALAQFSDEQGDSSVALLDASAALVDGHLEIDLHWQAVSSLPEQVTVFVHVIDEAGRLVAQADGDPLGGGYPMSQWVSGAFVHDERTVKVDGENLALRVGLYNRMTGERFPPRSAEGMIWPDLAVPVPVE